MHIIIDRISNRNRRRSKKASSVNLEENEVSLSDIQRNKAELEEAGKILDGCAYFDIEVANKRTKVMDKGTIDKLPLENKNEYIDLVTDLGWVKDRNEASLIFDYSYSNVSNMRMYDPDAPVESNPFFSGAAISGVGALQQTSGVKQDKKRLNPGMRKAKKNLGNNKSRPTSGESKR